MSREEFWLWYSEFLAWYFYILFIVIVIGSVWFFKKKWPTLPEGEVK